MSNITLAFRQLLSAHVKYFVSYRGVGPYHMFIMLIKWILATAPKRAHKIMPTVHQCSQTWPYKTRRSIAVKTHHWITSHAECQNAHGPAAISNGASNTSDTSDHRAVPTPKPACVSPWFAVRPWPDLVAIHRRIDWQASNTGWRSDWL